MSQARHRHVRTAIAALLVAGLAAGLSTAALAQPARRVVIEVKMDSFKFEPSQIRFNEGDTVVLRLANVDARNRRHNLASAWLNNVELTVRGDVVQGTSEGRKWVALEAGKQGEVEFVARGRGSAAFICSLFNHAEQGMTGAFIVGGP
ncbi:MAG: plastocyanin/azurin family copper-binding protein [Armatimonadota bacterium]|nr:plastocyanin/azurin family copper-binding protein [Armatimonadota bacterium]MDR7423546.1 plastocyanin/azurin family copper-binding protein [Armatimonadota bacterium]MDR7454669.1 plastocyanin/azurin family copper-binding protein [Armatimonadota bacterium]MDR7456589.1 plastocyanin/azurin family copper-binding protein [Armatimonadota bacterium]MDR7497720.1 plastocyanin/azurin family copper-binding protein [Armatimonadota bacterium]